MTRHSLAAAALVAGLAPQAVLAADPIFLQLNRDVKAAYYTPETGTADIAFLVMHEDANFMDHRACTELSARGYAALCVNGRADNNEALDTWVELPLDTEVAMKYLREDKGFDTVLLFAHSGGGPLLSYFQAVAEAGVGACNAIENLTPCGEDLAGLTPADGLVFFDAHPGTAINQLRSMNPALLDEADPAAIDPALDPFLEANGYSPKGSSSYTEAFQAAYFAAQSDRMNRLVDKAVEMRQAMADGSGPYPDEDVFYISRGAARLMQLDTSIDAETRAPRQLLLNDGTVVEQVVQTVRQPSPNLKDRDPRFSSGRLLTVHSFLGTRAVRSTDAMRDIDLESNSNSTGRNLTYIGVPILMMAASGHYFMVDNEEMFEMATSPDKEFIVVQGASHGITPCGSCAKATGEDYSNSLKNTFDYVDGWVAGHFAD